MNVCLRVGTIQEAVGGFASKHRARAFSMGRKEHGVHNCNPGVAIIHNSKTAASNSGIKVTVKNRWGRLGVDVCRRASRLSLERANFLCLFYLTRLILLLYLQQICMLRIRN